MQGGQQRALLASGHDTGHASTAQRSPAYLQRRRRKETWYRERNIDHSVDSLRRPDNRRSAVVVASSASDAGLAGAYVDCVDFRHQAAGPLTGNRALFSPERCDAQLIDDHDRPGDAGQHGTCRSACGCARRCRATALAPLIVTAAWCASARTLPTTAKSAPRIARASQWQHRSAGCSDA